MKKSIIAVSAIILIGAQSALAFDMLKEAAGGTAANANLENSRSMRVYIQPQNNYYQPQYMAPVSYQPAMSDSTRTVGSSYLNLRRGAASGQVIQKLHRGDQVRFLDTDGKWALVEYNGMQGYVLRRYLYK